jgi:hypothetical protein
LSVPAARLAGAASAAAGLALAAAVVGPHGAPACTFAEKKSGRAGSARPQREDVRSRVRPRGHPGGEQTGPHGPRHAEPGWAALQGLAGWTWLAAIAGFADAFTARRRQAGTATPRPAPAREPRWQRAAGYANQAVLPFYLLHEPVIVAFAWIIVRWHAPILVRYPVLVAASFTATLVIYELAVRRYRIARLLLGMKPRERIVDGRPLQTGAAEG